MGFRPATLVFVLLLPSLCWAQDSVIALPEITVSVTRSPTPLATAPMAVSVVDRSTLGLARQDLGIDDVVAGIPGVFLANRYNFSLDQRVSIRGFGSRSNFGIRGVKVLLDGVPQTLPDGQGQLSNVDIGAVSRVEVIRGSASSLYGNASGGVIALESAPIGRAPLASTARIESGAFGLFRWINRTAVRAGPFGAALSVARFQLDGFRKHSAAETFQLQAAGEYVLSGSTIARLSIAHAAAPVADNPGALTRAELDSNPRMAAPNNVLRGAGKDVSQQQASLGLRHVGAGGSSLDISLFGLLRRLDNPLATNVFVDLDRRAGGARLVLSRPLGSDGSALTLGADLQRMRDDRKNFVAALGEPTDSVLLDQLETVTELGPFLHLSWKPAGLLLVSAGARYDRVAFDVDDRNLRDSVDNSGSRTMAALSGHLGVSLTSSPSVVPYINVSTSFETPTTTELANQPGGSGGFNDQLDPQRAVNYELGVRGRPARGVEYSGAVFLARVDEALIQFAEVGGRAYFTNAGRLHNDGAELGLRLSRRAWDLSAAYTYAHYRFDRYRVVSGTTTDTLDGNQLAGVPAHYLRLALRLNPVPALRLDLEQQLSSRLFADDLNTIEVDGWGSGITTIRAAWTIRAGGLDLSPFAGVHNLFGRSYVASVTVNGFGGRVFEPGPGRNAYGGMEVTWSR